MKKQVTLIFLTLYLITCDCSPQNEDHSDPLSSPKKESVLDQLTGIWLLWEKIPGSDYELNPGVKIEVQHEKGTFAFVYSEGGSVVTYAGLKVECEKSAICKFQSKNDPNTFFIIRIKSATSIYVVSSPNVALPPDPNKPNEQQGYAPLISSMSEFRK